MKGFQVKMRSLAAVAIPCFALAVSGWCSDPPVEDPSDRGLECELVARALAEISVAAPVEFRWGGVWSLEYVSFSLIDGPGEAQTYYLKSDPMKVSPTVLEKGIEGPGPVAVEPLEIDGEHERALLILAANWALENFTKQQLTRFRVEGFCEDLTGNVRDMAGCAFVQLGDTDRFSILESLIWGTLDAVNPH